MINYAAKARKAYLINKVIIYNFTLLLKNNH